MSSSLKMSKLIFRWVLSFPMLSTSPGMLGAFWLVWQWWHWWGQLTPNSCHFQTCQSWRWWWWLWWLGAPGLFYVYYSAGPLEAGEVIVYDLNWQLQRVSFWGESPYQSNLNGCGVNRFTLWMPLVTSPLCRHLVMAQGNLPPTFFNI